MKKTMLLLGIFTMMLAVTSCNKEDNTISYETKSINIYRSKDKVDKTIDLRFYKEYPNVPYVGIKEYFKEFYKKNLNLEKKNDFNIFSIENKEYIKIDSTNSILGIKDTFSLGHHPDFKENTKKSMIVSVNKSISGETYKLIDLSKYDILTYNTSVDTYVPLGLLNNLYGGIEWYNIAYNGKDIYVFDFSGDLNLDPKEPNHDEEYFAESYYSTFQNKKEREKDVVKYNYNQLCFTFDNLRGYTNQLVFGDNNLVTLGLDTLLESYYPGIKRLLLSENEVDYEKGYLMLLYGMSDGGHTGFVSKNPPTISYVYELQKDNEFKKLADAMLSIDEVKVSKRQTLMQSRAKALGDAYGDRSFYYTYNNEYKTAIIGFDRFIIDRDLWDEYYKGNKDKLSLLEDDFDIRDTYAFVRKSLYKAKSDGASNVILDVSFNGGGSNDALASVIGLFNGAKTSILQNNTIDSSRLKNDYSIDINLDGKFDDQDINEAKSFNFKVSVLTSKLSFSCGNLLPALMKELGYKIIGEKSGGGSCVVVREETAEGFIYSRSGYLCLCNLAGDNIDSGVPLDYSLVNQVDGKLDYSKFYDIKTISEYLNK